MKKIWLTIVLFYSFNQLFSQNITLPSNGGNKKASVSEQIGITEIKIQYSRPGVKGREGKIWGTIVPFGFSDLGFGHRKPSPWRAGANENTTFQFSTDVLIEGKLLKAGIYGFHIAMNMDECIVIFSKNYTSWGSFFYEESEDALRVNVKPIKTEQSIEWLKYEFIDQTENSATIALFWEKIKIPLKVEVNVHQTVIENFRNELRSPVGFSWQAWNTAANYCLQNQINLEEALQWAEAAISAPFVGEENFTTYSTKSLILKALGRNDESEATIKKAIDKGKVLDLHNYGRQLITQKRNQEALAIFKLNATKHPNTWPVNVGLMRGYSAVGDYKMALKYAKLAYQDAPDPLNKNNIQTMIKNLEQGKDVN